MLLLKPLHHAASVGSRGSTAGKEIESALDYPSLPPGLIPVLSVSVPLFAP